ncbi:MAG: flagellar hook-length control protein FliK [Planctomycetota bacterium]
MKVSMTSAELLNGAGIAEIIAPASQGRGPEKADFPATLDRSLERAREDTPEGAARGEGAIRGERARTRDEEPQDTATAGEPGGATDAAVDGEDGTRPGEAPGAAADLPVVPSPADLPPGIDGTPAAPAASPVAGSGGEITQAPAEAPVVAEEMRPAAERAAAPSPSGGLRSAGGEAMETGKIAAQAPDRAAGAEAPVRATDPSAEAATGKTSARGREGALNPAQPRSGPGVVQGPSALQPGGAAPTLLDGESWFDRGGDQPGGGARGGTSFHLLDDSAGNERAPRGGEVPPGPLPGGAPPHQRAGVPSGAVPSGAARAEPAAPGGAEASPASAGGTATQARGAPLQGASPAAGTALAEDAAPATHLVRAGNPRDAALARRIYRLVRQGIQNGESELRVRLDPPRLGRVDVEVRVTENRLGILFQVDSEEVRQTLERHLGELERALEDTGYHSEGVDVELRDASRGLDRQNDSSPSGAEGGDQEDAREIEPDEGLNEVGATHLGAVLDLIG